MNSTFLNEFTLVEVKERYTNEFVKKIFFTVKEHDQRYWIEVRRKNGVFRPNKIKHSSRMGRPCAFCGKSAKDSSLTSCKALELHKNEVFHRLIEHPSIRLEWLYISHGNEE